MSEERCRLVTILGFPIRKWSGGYCVSNYRPHRVERCWQNGWTDCASYRSRFTTGPEKGTDPHG